MAGHGAGEALHAVEHHLSGRRTEKVQQAQVVEEPDAVYWVDGQGLYAEVVFTNPRMNGVRGRFAVGGDIFAAAGGAMHHRVLRPGEHVIVLLLEESPNGHGVIVSRVNTTASAPPGTVAFRDVTLKNLARTNFNLYGRGESYHAEIVDGRHVLRLSGDSAFVINDPDGGSFCFAGRGKSWMLKHASGSVVHCHGKGVTLKSPTGVSFIEISDSGINIRSKKPVKINGQAVMLNMGATDTPVGQSVAGTTAGPGAPLAGFGSASVFVGKT